jgi:hypothetical protein
MGEADHLPSRRQAKIRQQSGGKCHPPLCGGKKELAVCVGSPDGARASATFFSLIETAKANGLEPYAYLRFIFEKLPPAKSDQDLQDLLPQHIDPSAIAISDPV